MIKREYHVIGLMSGTSLDGVDLVELRFTRTSSWSYDILNSTTIKYQPKWKSILSSLSSLPKEDLQKIDVEYTELLANMVSTFIEKHSIDDIDFICSHGHTALHQPDKGFTYQIGNLPSLSELIGLPVVCDFRIDDVLLGGQGAPLVPIGDELLFSDFDFCINLGGFANISTKINNRRIAYDICPLNTVLNHYVAQLNFEFDEGGTISSKGEIDTDLLEELNKIKYYHEPYPKSLGIEWVETNIFPLIDRYRLKPKHILRTYVEHSAIQISNAIKIQKGIKILFTGGGAYNSFLMNRIQVLTNLNLNLPDNNVIEFKEALIFGLLGVLRMRNEINCLSSVTGATKDHCSGRIFNP